MNHGHIPNRHLPSPHAQPSLLCIVQSDEPPTAPAHVKKYVKISCDYLFFLEMLMVEFTFVFFLYYLYLFM